MCIHTQYLLPWNRDGARVAAGLFLGVLGVLYVKLIYLIDRGHDYNKVPNNRHI